MSWIGSLFSTDKVVDDVLDKDSGLLAKAGEWIGNQQYTDEEKAEMMRDIQKFSVEKLRALEPFKIMQRIMVSIIMSVWAVICLTTLVMIVFDATNIVDNCILFMQLNFVWVPVSGAVALYLLGGVLPNSANKGGKNG